MTPTPNLTIFDEENKPKEEVNYCLQIYLALIHGVSQRAGELFKNDPSIRVVWNSAGGFQRLFCNRYFLYILSKYTYLTGKNTLNEIFVLSDDASLDNWLAVIYKFIIPFLEEKNVYDIVHPLTPPPLID